mgnify:FL=1|jgi:hypothetical protein
MKLGVKLAIVGVAGYFIGLMLGIKNKYIDG